MQSRCCQNMYAVHRRGLHDTQAYNYIHQGALWAAVTLIVVSAPEFVGATAWLCVQRLLGNILGGETPRSSLLSMPNASAAASPADCNQHLMVVGWLACGLVIGVRSAVGLAFITFAVVVLTSFVRVSNWRAGAADIIHIISQCQPYLIKHLLLCSSMTSRGLVSDAHARILHEGLGLLVLSCCVCV
jgi:hypothetical protein